MYPESDVTVPITSLHLDGIVDGMQVNKTHRDAQTSLRDCSCIYFPRFNLFKYVESQERRRSKETCFSQLLFLKLEDFCRLHRGNCRSVRLPDTGDKWVQTLSKKSYREIRSNYFLRKPIKYYQDVQKIKFSSNWHHVMPL